MRNRLILVAVWMLGAGAVAIGGMLPDGYHQHVAGLPDPRPYPASGVLLFVAMLTVQVAVVGAVLRPRSYRASWQRALVALALSVAATVYVGKGQMHASPYQSMHFYWSAGFCMALAVLCAVGAVRRVGPARSRGRRSERSR